MGDRVKEERYTPGKKEPQIDLVTCRGCVGQFDDSECRHPHPDKRVCWHTKPGSPFHGNIPEMVTEEISKSQTLIAEALSRVHSHLIVLAEGQDAILRALGKRRRYGQG